MRTLIAAALLLLGLATQLQAAPAPFLWKIESAGVTHYLVGSVHLLPQQAQPLPPALARAVQTSDVLLFESDIRALSDAGTQERMLAAAQSDNGLKAEIGAALYQRLLQQLGQLKLPPSLCDRFRAWFCSMTLEVMHFMQEGFRPELGLDQQLYERAQQQQKSVRWLEPLDQHLGLFTGMTPQMSIELLASTLDELDEGDAAPKKLLKLWQDNDLAAIEKMLQEMKSEYPLAYERLLAARNQQWLGPLVTLLRGRQPVLVVVGAAHLAGSDGLLALLKARGFSAQPVAE